MAEDEDKTVGVRKKSPFSDDKVTGKRDQNSSKPREDEEPKEEKKPANDDKGKMEFIVRDGAGIHLPHSDKGKAKRGKGERVESGTTVKLERNKKTNQWLREGRIEIPMSDSDEDEEE